jgi:hypothetical protein
MEREAENQPEACPKRVAGAVIEKKAGNAEAKRAGERRRDAGEAGHELGDQQRRGAITLEHGLGLAHAPVGRERDTAHELQYAVAVAPPGPEPRQAAERRGENGESKRVDAIDRIRGGVRAGKEQQRRRRNRRAELLHQHHAEDRDQAVFGIEWNGLALHSRPRPHAEALLPASLVGRRVYFDAASPGVGFGLRGGAQPAVALADRMPVRAAIGAAEGGAARERD